MKKDNKEYNEKRNATICWVVIGGLYLVVFGGMINMIHNFTIPKKTNTEIKAGGNDTIKSITDYQGAVDSIKQNHHKSRGQR